MKKLFLLLFLLQCQTFAVFAIKDLRVEPAFAKPGEEMTIYFTMVHDFNRFISIGGMLSEDNSWEMSDRLFLFNGNEGKLPKENPTDWDLSYLFMSPNQEYIGWYEYSWKFIVPADLTEGDFFYLILRPDQANQPAVKALSSTLESAIKVEVSSNKAVVYNTATMGEKKATGSYIITKGLPKAELKATPSAGAGNTYTFTTAQLTVALETNTVPEAKIYYTKGSVPVDITNTAQLYDPANPVLLSSDDTINAVAVVPGFSNKKASWYYKQELPEATLFATPSKDVPDIYTFNSVELPVRLGLISDGDTIDNSNKYEIYYTLKNEPPLPGSSTTHQYTGPILLNGNDTIRAVAVSNNFSEVAEGVWYYEQDLPEAYIYATPSASAPLSYAFTTTALVVNLGVIGGGDSLASDKVQIYYTHNNKTPSIGASHTKLYSPGDPVVITGDDTIRAIATVEGFDEIPEGIWHYDQTLPRARLEADPGSETTYLYQSSTLPVRLSSNSGNTIYYTLNGDEPDFNSSSFHENGEVIISGDQTIKALAIGEGYSQADSLWRYEQKLPSMFLKADAGNSSSSDTLTFFFDTTVSLSVVDSAGNAIEDAKIYYLLDTVGNKGPASDGDLLYGDTFSIDTTVTIRALALHKEYLAATGEWNYKLVAKENWLKVFSSDSSYLGDSIIQGDSIVSPDDTIHFGYELDVVFETPTDSLRYEKDGKSTLYHTGDTLHLTASDPDTVRISVTSSQQGFSTLKQEVVFVRDTVAVLSASLMNSKFVDQCSVELYLSGSWRNSRIYYNLGEGEKWYRKPLKIDNTTALTAIARADFAVDSKELMAHYTKVHSIEKAFYRDSDGDGQIDQLHMVYEDSIPLLPDSIRAYSPLNEDDSVLISKDRLSRDGERGIIASFNDPFAFTGSTFFESAPLARAYGEQYEDLLFTVDDSVAPVLVEAIYRPGEIISVNPVKRENDELSVLFSEPVSIDDEEKPFYMKQRGGDYYLRFSEAQITENKARFKVRSIHGVDYPLEGDSIHIDIRAHVQGNGVTQSVLENRLIPMQVLSIPYHLLVQAVSPADPTEVEIPPFLESEQYDRENGLFIVGDFLMRMESDSQDGKITILDKVGNVIQQLESRDSQNNHLVCDVLHSDHTRVVFYWDGKNSLGRDVGSGEYMAVISIFDGRSQWHEKKVHLGIVREKK